MSISLSFPEENYTLENNLNLKLFLIGNIYDCEDWQSYVIKELINIPNLTIYSNRVKNKIEDKKTREQYLVWEFNHLREADLIIFWFSGGFSVIDIFYELGMHGNSTDTPIMIGIDPKYERKQDVIIQTSLARPEVPIFNSMQDMIEDIYNIFQYKE